MQTVTSKDGTQIAYNKTGSGPVIILVAGAMGTRSFGSAALAEQLAPHFTAITYDRRGRGESTNTLPYAVEREIEDIEALIDASGGAVYLYGISSGACLALQAAAKLGDKTKKLAMYEAPYNSDPADKPIWHDYYVKLQALTAAGDCEEAVAHFMRFVKVPEDMILGMRSQPMWPALTAVAPTLIYDADCMGGATRAVPVALAAQVGVPTLLLNGEKSQDPFPFMKASADELARSIPNAERRTIPGQGHDVSAEALTPVLIEFFNK